MYLNVVQSGREFQLKKYTKYYRLRTSKNMLNIEVILISDLKPRLFVQYLVI